jgi:NAD-dependent SIR2 family protein deacetylase
MYSSSPSIEELAALTDFIERGSVAVLTGAGLSTESGIPDYRGPEAYRRPRRPVQFQEFLKSAAARQRYWARSMLGWLRFAQARPNAGHLALRELEERGLVSGIVTQNVDSLHAAAGSEAAVELHGALRDTICLDCGRLSPRAELQAELERLNAGLVSADVPLAPDGDAELDDERLAAFRIVDCDCGGRLKPHVVFFGENVPKPRVERALATVAAARALLVVGSSLTVWSGYRFVRAAAARGQAIAIVGLGPTRGDAEANLRVAAGVGVTLTGLRTRLCAA